MTRWEKLSTVLLRLVDEARGVKSAVIHMSSEFGRACDTMERLGKELEETRASHQNHNQRYPALEARVSDIERRQGRGGE